MICLRSDNSPETLKEGFAPPAAIPLYFGPAERRLFGWYHPVSAAVQRTTAVVLCRPLGYEAMGTDASYRYLAERLAEAGYPALRFDYEGTGDSFGSDDDKDRLRSWRESIGFAIDTLRQTSGTEDITLFGVRFGATLAAIVASERGDVKQLILWAGFPNGRSYLRERRALHAAHVKTEANSPCVEVPPYEEAAGFILTAAAVAEILQVNVSALSRIPASEALLIDRDDLPGEGRLGERLAAMGTAVTRVKWPGYAAMMRDTQETEIPIFAVDSILAWLDGRVASPPGRLPCVVPGSDRLEANTYTEEPVLYGQKGTSFGILTLPRIENRRGKTAVLLLSVGANPHIGPNRMYVTLARQLAAQGFPVLRLDVPGVGDSARGATTGRQSIYSTGAIASVKEAMSHLEKRIGADVFALVGLCSGAYMAFQTAAEETRVQAQVLINPQTFEWRDGDSLEVRLGQSYKQTRLYVRSLRDVGTLKRVIRGRVNVKGIAWALFRRSLNRLSLTARNGVSLAMHLRPFETPVCHIFRAIARRGTDTLFIFSAQDFGVEAMAAHLGPDARRVRGQHQPRVEIIDGADHTFTPKVARDKLLSRITSHLRLLFPDKADPRGE